MTPADVRNIGLALAAVSDVTLSSVDPSGAALRRACGHLRAGLRLAEQMGAAGNDGALIVRHVVETIEETEAMENEIG